jgi:hypothetical protein
LRERWKERKDDFSGLHPFHPKAYALVHSEIWGTVFEGEDPDWTRTALEARAPLLDLRLTRFLLRVPPVPLSLDKELNRRSMRGLLPGAIIDRPKTPLVDDPLDVSLEKGLWHPEPLESVSELVGWFVLPDKWFATLSRAKCYRSVTLIAPFALARWFKDVSFEAGPEPDWAGRACSLPSRVICPHPPSEDAAESTFTLTEHGTADCYVLSYADGTRFVVDGPTQRVWGTFRPPNTTEDLATYFLGPVMGFVLRKRHVTSLHASCVAIGGHAVALCGNAGFGKSTTAAALALRGYPVLAEDIVPLDESTGTIHAVPGYPRVCLWPAAVAKLLGSPEALPELTAVWGKRYLALDGARARFWPGKLPLGIVYFFGPRTDAADAPRVEELSPREALLQMVQNTYMNWLLDREQRGVEFDMLSRLVGRVLVRRIVPSSDAAKLGALCSLIADDAARALAEKSVALPIPRP